MAADGEDRIDPQAVAALYQQHAAGLRAFLIGLLRDAHLAEEAQQVTFTRVMESGHTVQPDRFRSWMFRVANNEAMLLRRRQSVDRRAIQAVARRTGPARGIKAANPASSVEPVIDAVTSAEAATDIREALRELPPDQFEVVRLRIFEGHKFAEIARLTNVPLGTVLTRMRLALGRLSKALSDEYKDH